MAIPQSLFRPRPACPGMLPGPQLVLAGRIRGDSTLQEKMYAVAQPLAR
jgi:hypothetical protein